MLVADTGTLDCHRLVLGRHSTPSIAFIEIRDMLYVLYRISYVQGLQKKVGGIYFLLSSVPSPSLPSLCALFIPLSVPPNPTTGPAVRGARQTNTIWYIMW